MRSNRSENSKSIKISIKDRLGPRKFDSSILAQHLSQPHLKRQCENDTRLAHGLSDILENSSAKVMQENVTRNSNDGNFRERQRNLIEMSKTQQLKVGTSRVSGTEDGSGAELASAIKPVMKSTSTPSTVEKKMQAMAASTVASFLQSLGLSKYAVSFQAEEVDMLALRLMSDNDLKEMGLPMGPRKKILLGLARNKAKK